MMTSTETDTDRGAIEPTPPGSADAGRRPGETGPLGPAGLLGLAVWLGLLAGYLEVLAVVLTDHRDGSMLDLFGKSRHYPWMIPLTNAALFLAFSLPASALALIWRRGGVRLGLIVLGCLSPLPPLLVILSNLRLELYTIALAVLTAGIASRLLPRLSRWGRHVRRLAVVSTPVMLIGLVVLGGATTSRGLRTAPKVVDSPADGPNVLLIVLDTVRADHLDLYGYDRPTSPRISDFSKRGVRFDRAFAPAPWTLPSHASFLTGTWPEEVMVGRYDPIDDAVPTLAEVLSRRGYETAGFVANLFFCAYYTGLDRGFSRYVDYPTTPMRGLTSTAIGSDLLDFVDDLYRYARPGEPRTSSRLYRKDADTVNREFQGWLDGLSPDRPFFAFLNYFDAHDPYVVPEGSEHRFGRPPLSAEERMLMETWWFWPNKPAIDPESRSLLVDGYDSCIAYLDDRIGRLLSDLEDRGLLEETIVIITSDHGEAFGEHSLFGHGGSLYNDQIDVPLIIVGPGVPAGQSVGPVVSLRDLPATILDLVGQGGEPLPGASLSRLWEGESDTSRSPALAEVDGPDRFPPNLGRSPVFLGPMETIIDDRGYKYIRINSPRLGIGEELYQLEIDPGEKTNLARLPQMAPVLDSFRRFLDNPALNGSGVVSQDRPREPDEVLGD